MKKIIYKTPAQIAAITEAWKYLTELLHLIRGHTHAGVTWLELEEIASKFLVFHGVEGAFKWYNGYPANLCLSVNSCLVHGIPDATPLQDGDLIKIDAGVIYEGGIADAAISVIVWWPDKNPQWQALIDTTKRALDAWLKHLRPRGELITFGREVEQTMSQAGFSIIKHLTGHGVWTAVHEWPYIYNRACSQSKGVYFEENMVVALEPITAVSSTEFVERPGNSWNLYTSWGDLWAQWEYTVVITWNGHHVIAGIQEDL